MFNEAKAIASFGGRLDFAVSLGKDSAVMLHIMNQLTDFRKHYFFFWSMYPEPLPYQQRYLNLLERMYKIHINVFIWPELIKVKQADAVTEIMEREKCDLALFAYRMDESLQRRGMMKALEDGIDRKRRWAYPLRSFTSKTSRGYVKVHKVPLNIEYSIGLKHDLLVHRFANSIILRHFIGEEDYQAAIRQDPNIEIDYVRYINEEKVRDRIFGNEEKGIRGITKGFSCPNPPRGHII